MPGICPKSGKNSRIITQNLEKNLKFANSMFQVSLFKVSFTKIILIYFFIITTLSIQTQIQSQIDLGFHCFYLEITCKIHGILCHKRSGNPPSILTQDFYNLNLYESTWNLAQKNLKETRIYDQKSWENLEFGIWKKVGTLLVISLSADNKQRCPFCLEVSTFLYDLTIYSYSL